MGSEKLQQIKFSGRETYVGTAQGGDTAHNVQADIADLDSRVVVGRLHSVSLQDPDPRQKFLDAEGLGDVVVGTEVERGDLRALVGTARQDDDRDIGLGVADAADHLQAVDIGQSKVE